jgi:hypothetical protein
MIEHKGVDLLLLAFDHLVSRGLDVRLLLIGPKADLRSYGLPLLGTAKTACSFRKFRAQ